jgi:hypothetical protein
MARLGKERSIARVQCVIVSAARSLRTRTLQTQSVGPTGRKTWTDRSVRLETILGDVDVKDVYI